jgi:hypothetical protein
LGKAQSRTLPGRPAEGLRSILNAAQADAQAPARISLCSGREFADDLLTRTGSMDPDQQTRWGRLEMVGVSRPFSQF